METIVSFKGAMENWGLVTYRETYLLVDEANTSAATRQTVAVVVGHELAHQWFGNLVTMVSLSLTVHGLPMFRYKINIAGMVDPFVAE